MSHRLHSRTLLFAMLCVAILFVRVGGPHLHLCFDGQEPPVSVQFTGNATHTEHQIGETHADLDIALASELIAKSKPAALDLPILLLATLLLVLLPLPKGPRLRRIALCRLAPPPFLRPFAQGPPAVV